MTISVHWKFPSLWFGWYYNPAYRSLCVGLLIVAIKFQRSPSFAAKRRADTTEVDLHQASTWDCPECGSVNFCHMIELDPQSDQAREMAEDLPSGVEGDFLMRPERVICKYCTLSFSTADLVDGDPEDLK